MLYSQLKNLCYPFLIHLPMHSLVHSKSTEAGLFLSGLTILIYLPDVPDIGALKEPQGRQALCLSGLLAISGGV